MSSEVSKRKSEDHDSPRLWHSCLAAAFGTVVAITPDALLNVQTAIVDKMMVGLVERGFSESPVLLLVCVVFLILIGVGLCLVSRPVTLTEAFTRGISVFGLFTAMVPFNPGMGLSDSNRPSTQEIPAATDGSASMLRLFELPRVLAADGERLAQASAQQPGRSSGGEIESRQTGTARIWVDPESPFERLHLTLRDADGKLLGRGVTQDLLVPITQPAGTYLLDIESAGFRRSRASIRIEAQQAIDLTLRLNESRWPFAIEHLRPAEQTELENDCAPVCGGSSEEISNNEDSVVVFLKGHESILGLIAEAEYSWKSPDGQEVSKEVSSRGSESRSFATSVRLGETESIRVQVRFKDGSVHKFVIEIPHAGTIRPGYLQGLPAE